MQLGKAISEQLDQSLAQHKVNELPLWALFTRLRQAGLPLGMDEYKLLLQALQCGFGLPNEAAIARLCKTLWVKSEDDQVLFDYHFEAVMAAEREALVAQVNAANVAEVVGAPVAARARWRTLVNGQTLAKVFGGLAIAALSTVFWVARPQCPYFTSSPPGWLGFGGLIDSDEEYRYEVSACQGSPTSVPQIKVLLKPPELDFQINEDGTALLSGNFGTEDPDYIRVDRWDISAEPIAYSPFYQALFSVGHYGNTDNVQFSPDGQVVIVRTLDGDVQLWALPADSETDPQTIADLKGLGVTGDVQFSADGQSFVFHTKDNSARLYNLTGELLTDFGDHDSRPQGSDIREIDVSPSEQKLAVRLGGEGRAQLWDFNGNLLVDFKKQGIQEIEFSPDGRHVAMLSSQGQGQLFDIAGQPITRFEGANPIQNDDDDDLALENVLKADDILKEVGDVLEEVGDVLENADDASEDADDTLPEGISSITFSPDNQHIAIVLNAGVVQLWDVAGNLRRTIMSEGVREAHFSKSGERLLTRSLTDTAHLWALDGSLVTDFNDRPTIRAVAFSGNNVIINLGNDEAQLWNEQGEQQYGFDLSNQIFDFYLGPNDRYMVTRASDNTVTLWDLEAQRHVADSLPLIKDTKKVVFSPDGKSLITLSATNEVKLQVTGETKGVDSYLKTDVQSFGVIGSNNFQEFSDRSSTFGGVVVLLFSSLTLLLPIGYCLLRQVTHARYKPAEFPPVDELPPHAPTAAAALSQHLEDELQVAQSIQQGAHKGAALAAFTESNEYFPITRRQMKQSWRHLRRLVREGPATELDIEATIAQVSREGLLIQPALRPRCVNRNQLLLLIDQDGSMVPFHALSVRLAQTAIHGGRLASAGTYYFHNCPTDYLYDDPYHQSAHPISAVLSDMHSGCTSVVIFSDAGAARGAFNQQRLDLTLHFLAQLQSHLHQIVWLNPMPRDRWIGTAGEIAKRIPMFELTRQGLNQSIDVLRGKPFHF
ncbi:MAG: hypothetical protein AB8B99_04135 [Phormidesmis sp.]